MIKNYSTHQFKIIQIYFNVGIILKMELILLKLGPVMMKSKVQQDCVTNKHIYHQMSKMDLRP